VIAWSVGTAASLLFVNYENLFSNVASNTFFNDRLIASLHGADISGIVSMGAAAVIYSAGQRLRPA